MVVFSEPPQQQRVWTARARQWRLVVVMILGLGVRSVKSEDALSTNTSNLTMHPGTIAVTPAPEVISYLSVCRSATCIDPDADLRVKVKCSCDTVTADSLNGVSVENLCCPGCYCDENSKFCFAAGTVSHLVLCVNEKWNSALLN